MYLCVAVAGTQRKSNTATKYADSSLHRLHYSVLIPCSGVSLLTNDFGVSLLTFTMSDSPFRTDRFGVSFPTDCFEVSLQTDHYGVSLLTNWLSAPDWPLRGLLPNWLTLCSGLTNVLRPLFRSRRFSRAQLFVWSSRQNRLRKVVWTFWRRFNDAWDKIPSTAINPWTHTKTHSYTSTYIYIYIYIYIYTWILIIFSHWYQK